MTGSLQIGRKELIAEILMRNTCEARNFTSIYDNHIVGPSCSYLRISSSYWSSSVDIWIRPATDSKAIYSDSARQYRSYSLFLCSFREHLFGWGIDIKIACALPIAHTIWRFTVSSPCEISEHYVAYIGYLLRSSSSFFNYFHHGNGNNCLGQTGGWG